DDGDGQIDCGDSDCSSNPACVPEICGNGADDDGDGDIDCDDSECAGDDPACGEVCDNGVDDDGDGAIDCDDDEDCALDEDCEEYVGGTCIEQVELDCGDSASGTNWGMGSGDVIDVYGCSSWIEDGPEYTYVFRPESSESVTVCLSNESAETDVAVITEAGGCDGNNCIDIGTQCVTFDAVAGEQYYFVVDGYEGAMGSYDIDVTCPSTSEICDNGIDDDGNGVADCDDSACSGSLECIEICQESWVLLCGSFESFTTELPSATNQVDSYSCNSWEETGPEFAYYFMAPTDQPNQVTVSLNYDPSIDLDVFVLEDQGIPCNSESCIAAGVFDALFETSPGEEYWIVVDGYQGSSGAYDILVDCEPVPDAEICDDGIDNDGDGDIDCDDTDCAGSANCASYCDADAPVISCGQTLAGDNTWDPSEEVPGLTNSIDGYPCNIGNYAGPEMAFEWTASVTGTVEFSLVNPQPTVLNHDIIVLDGTNGECVNNQCLEGALGFNDVDIEAVAGYTYYFVVDGFDGAEGPFQVHLDCDP
ncbi:MAG: hypothetical protein VX498_15570, partial [Myxococcota bacterium]|nr:hypothetical protein [Myxococcota bacterium]